MVTKRPGEGDGPLVEVLAIVDSGADFSCFPLAIARDLGITDEELAEDPQGGTGVGSTFRIWRSGVPIMGGIGLFEPAPDGSIQPWGPGFDLNPAFTEHSAFLLGRADFFRAFTVTFEHAADGAVFHLDALA